MPHITLKSIANNAEIDVIWEKLQPAVEAARVSLNSALAGHAIPFEDVLPSESRLMEASDERALKEIYDTERHLLYVAATRARERLWLSAIGAPSEFLDDLLA